MSLRWTPRPPPKGDGESGAWCESPGQSAIVQMLPTVDVIVGTLNLVLLGAMGGEITPTVACAILNAKARGSCSPSMARTKKL